MKHPHTQLENETLEALAKAPLTARQFRVVLALLRLTNGFHLTENRVGTKYLSQLTHLPRQHLRETLNSLAGYQVIARDVRGMVAVHGPALWNFDTPFGTPIGVNPLAPPSVSNQANPVTPPGDPPMTPPSVSPMTPPGDPPKENPLKKTLKENIAERSKKGRTEKAMPDPRVTEVMTTLEGERGWKSPSYAAEAGAVKWILRDYTPEDLLGCWHYLKTDPFWEGKALLMMSVRKQIGTWVSMGRPPMKPAPTPAYLPKTSRIEKLPAREEFAENKPW